MDGQAGQSISISEFQELCESGVKTERAISGWINQPDKQPIAEKVLGPGGTSTSLPREDVVQMFQMGIIKIDEKKLELVHYRRKYDQFKEKYGLADEELRPKKG